MRSSDNGDEMSTMVNTVLSGFEYRAQKEEYDNLKQFFEENEDNYQYTGYTKEAINKTQNAGYQNEYFYIVGNITSLKDYRTYFEPLINKNDNDFKEGMKKAYKYTNYEAQVDVVTTLFSTKNNYSKKNNTDNVFNLADDLESKKNMPSDIDLTLRYTDSNINSIKPRYDDKDVTSFGVFDGE